VNSFVLAALLALVTALASAQAQQAPATANPAPAGNVENGRRSFTTFACSACHGYSGHGGVEVGAPRIATIPTSFANFVKYVRQPSRSMPRYATESQIPETALADIYAFLKSIPPSSDPKSIPLLQSN
jgi:cytochrome c553